MNFDREDFYPIIDKDFIYVFGGGQRAYDNTYLRNSQRWDQPLFNFRIEFQLHFWPIIIVFIDSFDMKRNQWQNIKRMKHARCFARAVAMNDSIFIVGGHNKLCSKSRFVERYNPATNEWTEVANMHCTRGRFVLIEWIGYLYAIAGNSGGIVERYDCAKDVWNTVRNEYCNPIMTFIGTILSHNIYLFKLIWISGWRSQWFSKRYRRHHRHHKCIYFAR